MSDILIAIVRQISYYDTVPSTSNGSYYIWSSLTNRLIGNFCVSNNSFTTSGATLGQSMFVSNPQTILTGVQSTTNNASFQIQRLTGGAYVQQTSLSGVIDVQIDFLKFKNRD
jgi:hypothetical protein